MLEPNSRSPHSSEESSPESPRFLGDGISDAQIRDALRDDTSSFPRPSGALVFLLVALAAAFIFWLGAHSAARSTAPPLSGPFAGESASTQTSALVVHVAGAVKKPGVYQLPFDSRVQDAIQKAGGAKNDADVNAMNLAAFVEDGAKIEVPQKPQAAPRMAAAPASTPLPAPELSSPAPTEYSPPLPRLEDAPREDNFSRDNLPSTPSTPVAREKPKPAKTKSQKPKTEKPKALPNVPRALTKSGAESQKAAPEYLQKHPLNLNKASAEELQLLPGVGPAMAAKILEARKAKGGFKSVDELDDVPGIGAKKLEKLRPLVVTQ